MLFLVKCLQIGNMLGSCIFGRIQYGIRNAKQLILNLHGFSDIQISVTVDTKKSYTILANFTAGQADTIIIAPDLYQRRYRATDLYYFTLWRRCGSCYSQIFTADHSYVELSFWLQLLFSKFVPKQPVELCRTRPSPILRRLPKRLKRKLVILSKTPAFFGKLFRHQAHLGVIFAGGISLMGTRDWLCSATLHLSLCFWKDGTEKEIVEASHPALA